MFTLLPVVFALAADPKVAPPKKEPQGKLERTTPRGPSPLAPSLPELSDEEEKKLDAIIDRFIEADTGNLKGPEAKIAVENFKGLGPESFFALVRGLNKSANIEHSCPAVTIARKLTSIVRSSTDKELLQYARENIGLGVKKSKHADVLAELKNTATARQNSLKGRR